MEEKLKVFSSRKLKNFSCINPDCKSFNLVVEKLAREELLPDCSSCNQQMKKELSFPVVAPHVSWSSWRI